MNDQDQMREAFTAAAAAALEKETDAKAKASAESARLKAHIAAMTAQYGPYVGAVERAAKRNEQLAMSVKDGTFSRQSREMAGLTRQYETLRREADRLQRIETLRQRYGKTGGMMAYYSELIARSSAGRLAVGAAGVVGATTVGMATSGFQGTVEWNRMQLELQMISRELAGAFLPAVKTATQGLGILRKNLESLGPDQQDAIMYGGLALGGLTAAGLARMGLGGVGRVLGLVGGGVGGVAAGGAAAGGLGATGTALAGGVGGAAATAGVGGAAAGGLGTAGVAAGGAAAGGLLAGGKKMLGKGLRFAGGRVLPAFAVADGATGGYYSELRARGENKLTAGVGALGGGLLNGITFGEYGKQFREKRGTGQGPFSTPEQKKQFEAGGADPNRRMVTYDGAGFESSGSAFERIANAYAIREAQDMEDAQGKERGVMDILKFLLARFGTPEPPPSR